MINIRIKKSNETAIARKIIVSLSLMTWQT